MFNLIVDFKIHQKLLFSKFECHKIACQIHLFLKDAKFWVLQILGKCQDKKVLFNIRYIFVFSLDHLVA